MRKNLDLRASQFSVATYSSSVSRVWPSRARLKFLLTRTCTVGLLSPIWSGQGLYGGPAQEGSLCILALAL